MGNGIGLISDFSDYYDDLFTGSDTKVYRRLNSDRRTKVEDLTFLNSLNVPTIDIKPVTELRREAKKCVVYTDIEAHGGKGKVICSLDEAINYYPNFLASEFIDGTNGYYMKFLQVGGRSFQLMMYNPDYEIRLNPGSIVSVTEMPPGFNSCISIPIFSIDYIPSDKGMIAVDFNSVQNLGKIGFQKYLTKQDVMQELNKIFNH